MKNLLFQLKERTSSYLGAKLLIIGFVLSNISPIFSLLLFRNPHMNNLPPLVVVLNLLICYGYYISIRKQYKDSNRNLAILIILLAIPHVLTSLNIFTAYVLGISIPGESLMDLLTVVVMLIFLFGKDVNLKRAAMIILCVILFSWLFSFIFMGSLMMSSSISNRRMESAIGLSVLIQFFSMIGYIVAHVYLTIGIYTFSKDRIIKESVPPPIPTDKTVCEEFVCE